MESSSPYVIAGSMDEETENPRDSQTNKPLKAILHTVEDTAAGETVDLKTVIEAFGNRAFGPIMLLCSLFLLTPIGILPGVPAGFGLVIILFAIQLLVRRPHPWMPNIIARVKITVSALEKTKKVAGPWLDRIDNVVRPRFEWAASGPMLVVIALVSILLGMTMFPLSAVPFGVVAPAFVIGLLGLGITARDGVFALAGLFLSIGVPVLILRFAL